MLFAQTKLDKTQVFHIMSQDPKKLIKILLSTLWHKIFSTMYVGSVMIERILVSMAFESSARLIEGPIE